MITGCITCDDAESCTECEVDYEKKNLKCYPYFLFDFTKTDDRYHNKNDGDGKQLAIRTFFLCFLDFLDGTSETLIGGIGDLIGGTLNHLILELPLEDITQILVDRKSVV